MDLPFITFLNMRFFATQIAEVLEKRHAVKWHVFPHRLSKYYVVCIFAQINSTPSRALFLKIALLIVERNISDPG